MGIKGLVRPGEPGREIGQVRLGRRTIRDGKPGPPEKLDHFEILTRGPNGDWVRDTALHAVIGERPREIEVLVAGDTPAEVFHNELALYRSSGRRLCYGDGEAAQVVMLAGDRARVDDSGDITVARLIRSGPHEGKFSTDPARRLLSMAALSELQADPEKPGVYTCEEAVRLPVRCSCPLMASDAPEGKRCKPHGILRVQLVAANTFGPVWLFRTTSWNSIRSIAGFLEALWEQIGQASLRGVPFRLHCTPQSVDVAGRRQRIHVAFLSTPLPPLELLDMASQFRARRGALSVGRAMLPALSAVDEVVYDLDDPAVAAEIEEEFHPEAVEPEPETEADPEPEAELDDGLLDDGPSHDDLADATADLDAMEF